jgi:dolichol-phosphate mannosyltransferase
MNLVVTPTLNERENVRKLAKTVLALPRFALLIVDDNSPDGTWNLVQELKSEHPELHLLHRKEKPGFRNSYVDGFRWALEKGVYQNIFTMDADFSHPPKKLIEMAAALDDQADMAIGSRYVDGGAVENWSFLRRTLSLNANRFARTVTGMPVRDCTAGFTGTKASHIASLELEKMKAEGYAFLIELKYHLIKNGARVKEVPITFTDRQFGETKFNTSMIGEAAKTCWRLRSE